MPCGNFVWICYDRGYTIICILINRSFFILHYNCCILLHSAESTITLNVFLRYAYQQWNILLIIQVFLHYSYYFPYIRVLHATKSLMIICTLKHGHINILWHVLYYSAVSLCLKCCSCDRCDWVRCTVGSRAAHIIPCCLETHCSQQQ